MSSVQSSKWLSERSSPTPVCTFFITPARPLLTRPLADNWRVKRVQAVAALAGESVEEVTIDMAETKKPAFLAKFPLGCVPAFEGTDGVMITETAAIAEHGKHRCFHFLALPCFRNASRRNKRFLG